MRNPGILKKPAPSMAPGEKTLLRDMTAVPAAWPLETVLDAWVHTAAWRHSANYATYQHALDLLEQRIAELWEPKPLQGFAEELRQRGRAKLPRCNVWSFTNEGLVREDRAGWDISDWSWLEAASQRLAQRLATVEDSATEEAKKRRRVEEDSAAQELRKAKEETASLAGRLQEAGR